MAARRARELPLALVVAARPAAPGHAHARARRRARVRAAGAGAALGCRHCAAGRGGARPVGVRRGWSRGRARSPAATRCISGSCCRQARVRGVDPMSDVFVDDGAPPQLVRLVGDRLERLSPAATTLARAVAVLGADAEPGRARALAGLDASEAIAAEEELRDERVLDAARVRLHASGGRGGGARGDRRSGRGRAARARSRAARRRRRGRSARRRAPGARPAAR